MVSVEYKMLGSIYVWYVFTCHGQALIKRTCDDGFFSFERHARLFLSRLSNC